MSQEATVCVVDDDEAVRDSLQVLLETMGYRVNAYDSGVEFLENCALQEAGCVLVDVRMPKMSGLEVQQRLRTDRPELPVIIVTGHGDVPMAVQAMRSGAVDFIEKPFDEDMLLASVESAMSLARKSHEEDELKASIRTNIARLTPREREVFDRLIIGHANKVVARKLNCSPRTVEIHRARIMEKMAATSIAHLVRMALAADIEITDD